MFETQKGVFVNPYSFGTLLYDVEEDPKQLCPLNDQEAEAKMIGLMVKLLKENDAPKEQYARLGLEEWLD